MRINSFFKKAQVIGAFLFLSFSTIIPAQIYNKKYLWPLGSTVHIHFVDGSESQKEFVESVAREWLDYANLEVVFHYSYPSKGDTSHVRVSFEHGGTSTMLGAMPIIENISIDEITMGLEIMSSDKSDAYKRAFVLHEFGHLLGLLHEHQHPNFPLTQDLMEISSFCDQSPHYESLKSCMDNFLKLSMSFELGVLPYDRDSIMHYELPVNFTKERELFSRVFELSPLDIKAVEEAYPLSLRY